MLGALIERVTGLGLDMFLSQVLGMVGARYLYNPDKKLPIVATSKGNLFEIRMIDEPEFGYEVPEKSYQFDNWRNYRLKGETNDGNAYYAMRGVSGHAGLFGRAEDINSVADFLMSEKQVFIKKWVIQEFLGTDQYGNGLGWSKSSFS